MKLVDKLSPDSMRYVVATFRIGTGEGCQPWTSTGIVIDGVLYALEGQPPVAHTNGWGIVPGTDFNRRTY